MARRRDRSAEEIDFAGLLSAVLDDDVDKFSTIMKHAPNPDVYFNTTKYELPKILSAFPPILSVCSFFSAERCLESLIKMRPKFDKCDKLGRAPMHFACAGGSIDIINKIAWKPAHFNIFDSNGSHPISYAAMFGRFDALKFLISQCPGVDLIPSLCAAAKFGHFEIVRYFVDELKLTTDNSVLNCACSNGNEKIINFLIDNGADVNQPEKETGILPIVDACSSGRLEVVKLLISKGAKYVLDGEKFTPFIESAACGYINIVKYFVSLGIDVNIKNEHGATALLASLELQNLHITNYLISKGADISDIPNVLQLVAQLGDTKLLLKTLSLITISAEEMKSKNLLVVVLNSGNFENLQVLLNYGLELSVQDIVFFNLVELALKNEKPEIIKFLFSKGVEVATNKGLFKAAMNNIKEKNNYISPNMLECLRLIIEAGANIYCGVSKIEFFFKLFEIQSPELYKIILDNRPDFEIQKIISSHQEDTWSYLCNFDEYNKPNPLLDFFLSNLIDVNATNSEGFSLLHYIIQKVDDPGLVSRVISKGADVNLLTNVHTSPLLACSFQKRYLSGCVLLENGADPNITGIMGEYPIEISAKTDLSIFYSKQLLDHRSQTGNAMKNAIHNSAFGMIVLLIRYGADYSSLDCSNQLKRLIRKEAANAELLAILKEKRSNGLIRSLLSKITFCNK